MSKNHALIVLFLLLFSAFNCFSQTKMNYKINRIGKDFSVDELDNKTWKKAQTVEINRYWSGENAPVGRHFRTKMLWSETALYVRFEANQTEPLIVSEKPNLESKTKGLWDRDVCEIFLAPDRKEFRKYFEFEIAPNGEWIDLGIYQMPEKRETDFNYNSGMKSAAKIETGKVSMAIKIEWRAFGKIPKAGDVWLGNLLRCVGAGETRGYLAWSPTETEKPNFHIPERFGEFEFVK